MSTHRGETHTAATRSTTSSDVHVRAAGQPLVVVRAPAVVGDEQLLGPARLLRFLRFLPSLSFLSFPFFSFPTAIPLGFHFHYHPVRLPGFWPRECTYGITLRQRLSPRLCSHTHKHHMLRPNVQRHKNAIPHTPRPTHIQHHKPTPRVAAPSASSASVLDLVPRGASDVDSFAMYPL